MMCRFSRLIALRLPLNLGVKDAFRDVLTPKPEPCVGDFAGGRGMKYSRSQATPLHHTRCELIATGMIRPVAERTSAGSAS